MKNKKHLTLIEINIEISIMAFGILAIMSLPLFDQSQLVKSIDNIYTYFKERINENSFFT